MATNIFQRLNELNSLGLITDRTQADVDYALELQREAIHTNENLRGAYNASDRNRVAAAINGLVNILRDTGYSSSGQFTHVKSNWSEGDIVKVNDNLDVLESMRELQRLLPEISLEIPTTLDSFTWQMANALERILFDMIDIFNMLADMWLWCGEGYAGYDFEEHRLDDHWIHD